jgi:phosphomevalonate kinase
MGKSAGVEIEPDDQTTLADATMGIEGVLAAGVPGAGGQDALFAIVLSSSSRQKVEQLWSKWGSDSLLVCPLMLRAATKDRSGVQPEFEMQW